LMNNLTIPMDLSRGQFPPNWGRNQGQGWTQGNVIWLEERPRPQRVRKCLQLRQTWTLCHRMLCTKAHSELPHLCPRLHGPEEGPVRHTTSHTPHQPPRQCP
jgi:hypothetical protein